MDESSWASSDYAKVDTFIPAFGHGRSYSGLFEKDPRPAYDKRLYREGAAARLIRFVLEEFSYLDDMDRKSDRAVFFEELMIAAYLVTSYVDMGVFFSQVYRECLVTSSSNGWGCEIDPYAVEYPSSAFALCWYVADPHWCASAMEAARWRLALDMEFRDKVFYREFVFYMKYQEFLATL